MRIGFDAKRAFNNHTGLGNYSRFVISSLLRYYKGNDYVLFTPKIHPDFKEIFTEEAAAIITPQDMIGKVFSSVWRTYNLTEEITRQSLDVFHGLSNELPVGIGRFSGKKVVTIHDLIFLHYPEYYPNIDRFIYTRKFRNACQQADLVIAASEQTRNDILRFFHTDEKKVQVIYQDCDPQFEAEWTARDLSEVRNWYKLPDRFILCVGTIEQRKNQLRVLEAFHKAGLHDLSLVFVGRQTTYTEKLHKYIQDNKMESRVQFVSSVRFEDLPAIYRLATLFVYASEFEGFGIPVLEAMKCGVPAILANSSSLPEVGGDAAVYFNPFNSGELAELLVELSADAKKRAEMIRKAEQQLIRFKPEQLTAQLMKAYLQ